MEFENLTVAEQNHFRLKNIIAAIRDDKPNDRSELDRRYAILLTDLEKIEAYYAYWIITEGED